MTIQPLHTNHLTTYNAVVHHPLQSIEWGNFREKTGISVIRRGFFEKGKIVGGFQLTLHPIPKLPFKIGYLPKGDMPTDEVITELKVIGKKENCIFIQLEPNLITSSLDAHNKKLLTEYFKPAAHPLFTKYTFVLDLTQSEEEILKNMHPKARYNIRVATKKGVTVKEDNSDAAFKEYLRLTQETTTRQGFYAHTEKYHTIQWQTLPHEYKKNQLSSHLLTTMYQGKTLTAWILFVFEDTLYYPYGASSSEHRDVMASNLIMWEAIRFGKKLGLKKFDMWGALGPEPDRKDPWFGFHDFKRKYGPDHVEFVGSYDLVINPALYQAYKLADKLRWFYLKFKK